MHGHSPPPEPPYSSDREASSLRPVFLVGQVKGRKPNSHVVKGEARKKVSI